MKTFTKALILSVAACVTLMADAGPITDNVPVTVNVQPECEFTNQSTAPELAFGDYYAYSTEDLTATTDVNFRCVENTDYEVVVTSDNGDVLTNGSSQLEYSWEATGDMGGTSDSTTAVRTITIAGVLPGTGSQVLTDLTTGEHTDNLLVTINY